MSIAPKARTGEAPALTADRNSDGRVDFREAIDRIKEVNSQTDVLKDDIKKTAKDTAQIALAFKEYLQSEIKKSKENRESEKEESSPTSTKKLIKMNKSVYQGSYEGIIDGLAKVEENRKIEKAERERTEAQKQFAKTAAKSIITFPNAFRKGLINLFAFEKSEILQTYRAIRHSVGIDDRGNVDYAQRAFRLMLEDKSGKNKNLSPASIGTQQIEILDRIAGALGAESSLTSDRSVKKHNQTQIDLLRDIRTGVGAQRRSFLQVQGLTWKRTMSQSAFQTTVLQDISSSLKHQTGGFFGFFKKTESEAQILSDIRDSLAPSKQKPGFWTKPRYIFKRDKGRIDIGEQTVDSLQNVIGELRYQTEGLESIYSTLNGVINVRPVSTSVLTPFEAENIKNLKGIEYANIAEIDAIAKLPKALCSCFSTGTADDYNLQKSIEGSIGFGEREQENMNNVISIRDSAAGIYDIMLKQANGPDIRIPQKGMIETAKGMLSTAGDLSEVVQGTKSIKDMITGNKPEVDDVTLSDKTMERFEKMFESIEDDDSLLDGLKKRKKRRGKNVLDFPDRPTKATKIKKPPLIQRGKDALNKGKNVLSKSAEKGKGILSGAKGLAIKGGTLAASTVPVMTGGLGLGGMLTAGGSTIAGAGAGALAGAAGLATAAGAAGYGIGTLIDKGINAGMAKITEGKSKSLGEWLWNVTHKKELAAQQEQAEKLKKLQAGNMAVRVEKQRIAAAKAAKLQAAKDKESTLEAMALINKQLLSNEPLDIQDAIITKLSNFKSGIDVNKILDTGKGIGIGGVDIVKGVADNIVEQAQGLKVNQTLTAIYEKSEKARIELMSEMKEALDTAKNAVNGSETARAIGQSISEVSNVVTGATTNITVPVSAHDVDRGMNVLNSSYSS